MELTFIPPQGLGETLSFAAAVLTALLGLLHLIVPRRLLGLTSYDGEFVGPSAGGLVRARIGGFHLLLGAGAIILAQPLVSIALGFAWAGAAIGRLIALLVGPAGRGRQFLWLVIEIAIAAAALAGPFGYV